MKRAWVWVAWLLFLIGSFAVLEGMAIHDNTTTLSRFVWTVTFYFPAFPFIAGFLAGFLACHFWWGGIVPFEQVQTKEK